MKVEKRENNTKHDLSESIQGIQMDTHMINDFGVHIYCSISFLRMSTMETHIHTCLKENTIYMSPFSHESEYL